MKIPAFKIRQVRISLPVVLNRLGYFERAISPDLSKFVMDLTGKRPVSCKENKEDLLKAVWEASDKVSDVLAKNIIPAEELDWLKLSVMCRTILRPDGCYIAALVETYGYYVMPLEYLDRLESESPAVYRIVRDLLNVAFSTGSIPVLMPDEILEWLFPDGEQYTEDEEDQKLYESMKKLQIERYRYHNPS